MNMQQLQTMVPATNVKIVVGTMEDAVTSVGVELDGIRFLASRLPFIGPEKKLKTLQTLQEFANRLRLVGINVEGEEQLEPLISKAEQSVQELKQLKK
jgi:hypothetical protein